MDVYQPNRKPKGRARQRMASRQQRQMATPRAPEAGTVLETRASRERQNVSMSSSFAPSASERREANPTLARAGLIARDVFWRLRNDLRITFIAVIAVVLVFLLFTLTHVTQSRIFPNVWALGLNLGDTTVEEAANALQQLWSSGTQIQLVDGERQWALTPAQLGLRLDARATAESARSVGMSGLPFGYSLLPTVEVDELQAQNILLDYTEITKIVPYNAGYRWEGDELVGIAGSDGRFLDVAMTIQKLQENLAQVADERRLELVMTPVEPDILDPSPYLSQAQALTSQTFILRAYDPFTNETVAWTPDRDTFTSWLEAGTEALSLRADAFAEYVALQTETLSQADALRYIEPSDAISKVREAIGEGSSQVTLRVRYRTTTYEVQSGDSGYRIARRTGVPFFLMEQANPNRDWDAMLTPGELVYLPSPDDVVPLDPVPNKRIIVNLDTQTLYAYENGQLVFNWLISSGMDQAPTSPGIYQILSHADTAEGSSIELCGDNSCGSWTMYWFMGIYEVSPGLVNGLHGRVVLPGGTLMGNGTVGRQFTYGCVMSIDSDAEQLYRWAEEGTMVEIISREYPPRSDLARQALALDQGAAT
jgi:lipoprotein-anchoring transpeptidase ErfK/SrfK